MGAGEHAGLGLRRARRVGAARSPSPIVLHGRAMLGGGDLVDQRMLRREHHVGGAEQRVRPRREHADRQVVSVEGEVDHRALRPADPVALHHLDGLRPVDQRQLVGQPVGVCGDAQHPLAQRAAVDRMISAVAPAVARDLLVGQHRPERRAPVHQRVGQVGQPMPGQHLVLLGRVELVPVARPGRRPTQNAHRPRSRHRDQLVAHAQHQLARLKSPEQHLDRPGLPLDGIEVAVVEREEDPLRPPVVAGVGGGETPAPVIGEPQALELAHHGGDVPLGRDPRVDAVLDGELLRRKPEGVEAHRVQDVEAAHALVARHDVGRDVAERMTHVQSDARGIRKHVQHVVLRLLGIEPGIAGIPRAERLVRLPVRLPASLHGVPVVGRHESEDIAAARPNASRTTAPAAGRVVP